MKTKKPVRAVLSIRLTAGEFEEIATAAECAGDRVSTWVRKAALARARAYIVYLPVAPSITTRNVAS